MLVDTDVLIWHLRGNPRATMRLDRILDPAVSAITYMELLQGFRSREEMRAVQQSLVRRKATRLPVTPEITGRAIDLMETLSLSHGLQLADALIAATALQHGLTVLTANTKHFGPIQGLVVEKFEP